MSTTTESEPAAVAAATTRREDRVLLVTTAILVVGLFSDGWAHVNIVDELEGFVTPWHTIVFVGFVLTAGWVLLLLHDRRTPGQSLRSAVPPGYELAVLSLGVFFVGFNGDALWHTVFGIESDVDALLSPTHLLMAAALLAMTSTPYRSRRPGRPPTWASDAERVASLVLTTLVVGFFLLYLWTPAFDIGSALWGTAGMAPFLDGIGQIAVLGSLFALTALVLVPVLLLARAGQPPAGAVLLLTLLPATALTAIREFANAQVLLAFLAAGLVGEVLVRRLTVGRRQLLAIGAVVPAVLWTVHWTAFAVVHGLGWDIELYTGQVLSSAMAGAGLAALVADGLREDQPAPSPVRTNR